MVHLFMLNVLITDNYVIKMFVQHPQTDLFLYMPGTKEAASACNHSLMKLVTPEDDEDDEESQTKSSPPSDDVSSKKEGDLNGQCLLFIHLSSIQFYA